MRNVVCKVLKVCWRRLSETRLTSENISVRYFGVLNYKDLVQEEMNFGRKESFVCIIDNDFISTYVSTRAALMFLDKSSTAVNNNIVVITNITYVTRKLSYIIKKLSYFPRILFIRFLSYFRLAVCDQFKYKICLFK